MYGLFRLITHHVQGTGLITLAANELLGKLTLSPSTDGIGNCTIYENNAQGRAVIHFHTNIYVGQWIKGPFVHSSKRLWYVVEGTGVYLTIYAWQNDEARRSQF